MFRVFPLLATFFSKNRLGGILANLISDSQQKTQLIFVYALEIDNLGLEGRGQDLLYLFNIVVVKVFIPV